MYEDQHLLLPCQSHYKHHPMNVVRIEETPDVVIGGELGMPGRPVFLEHRRHLAGADGTVVDALDAVEAIGDRVDPGKVVTSLDDPRPTAAHRLVRDRHGHRK